MPKGKNINKVVISEIMLFDKLSNNWRATSKAVDVFR